MTVVERDGRAPYHLIAYDRRGDELPEAGGRLGSELAVTTLTATDAPVTDVFLVSHGWQADLAGALAQYDDWFDAMRRVPVPPGVVPAIVALHWPSRAWSATELIGDGKGLLGPGGRPAAAAGATITVSAATDEFAGLIADGDASRTALRTVLDRVASTDPDATVGALPAELVEAYRTLRREAGLVAADALDLDAAPGPGLLGPGSSGDDWDPTAAAAVLAGVAATGGGAPGLLGSGRGRPNAREVLLAPLRQLSFWTMKDRARTVGERGGSALLRRLQTALPDARIHLLGHSFGTIVVSSAVRGPGEAPTPPLRPAQSLVLVQGAASLWAFAARLPKSVGTGRGRFADVVGTDHVAGPIVATRSEFDYAVHRYYPLAAGLAGQKLLGGDAPAFPKYGAIGAFGLRGAQAIELPRLEAGDAPAPALSAGRRYNVDASRVIADVRHGGVSGAHSDIAHEELGRLVWNAALALPPG